MKVVLFLFAAVFILLCALLACPVEVDARARVKPRFAEARADIYLLGAIKITADALAVWLPPEADIRINGRRIRLKKRQGRGGGILPSVKKGAVIRRLHITGEFGMAGDGANTVIAAGIMRELGLTACILSGAGDICADIRPALERSAFCINLEGIAQIIPAQIIFAEAKRRGKTRRKEKYRNASC